jgi:cytochrome c-type biogenesis protein CcmF
MTVGILGRGLIWSGLIFGILAIVAYVLMLKRPESHRHKWTARGLYVLTTGSLMGVFACIAWLMQTKQYLYQHVWQNVNNEMNPVYRFAGVWASQEGSFLLWASMTALIGLFAAWKAGKYEARIMPFYIPILVIICAMMLDPAHNLFALVPKPSPADFAANPGLTYPFPDGRGLNPSLQNYWMRIHPPTIFFGFSSLLIPYVYAIAALIWKDYDRWTPRVMPYALLSSATLGLGLFMGGYWAYETQGWHGFWAWDPVENVSFFPWLAVTALLHGLVVQKVRGGMARTNTFLGIFSFSLFLLGTFISRSGVLTDSVHAFVEASQRIYIVMLALVAVYFFAGMALWLARYRSMPKRSTRGDTLVSRDFASYISVLLMLVACIVVTIATTHPIWSKWFGQKTAAPEQAIYNRIIFFPTLLAALFMGFTPWVAWRKTNPDTFLRKLFVPWMITIIFGFGLVVWVMGAESAMAAIHDPQNLDHVQTAQAWGSHRIQRMAVIALAAMGFFAALSNAMLAYRVLRAKPLAAGGWIAHVGIGVLIVGVIISNTYERTTIMTLRQGGDPKSFEGYQFQFEKMTGKPMPGRPLNPDYDVNNTVQIRVTPPNGETGADGAKTFLVEPRWFVHNKSSAMEDKFERMRWPDIKHPVGHDLYVALANDPQYGWPTDDGKEPGFTFQPKEKKRIGDYLVGYFDSVIQPQRAFQVQLAIVKADAVTNPQASDVYQAIPTIRFIEGQQIKTNMEIEGLTFDDGRPAVAILDRIDPATKEARIRLVLPGRDGSWEVPLSITYKPGINVVWTGVLIAVGGTLWAMVRRAKENRQYKDTDPPANDGLKETELEAWDRDTPPAPLPAAPIVLKPQKN